MRTLRHILAYLFWIVLSLCLGIGYMRIVLGPNDVSEDGIWYLLHLFFEVGLIQVGLWVGFAIATCFILLDVFYLRKKLTNTVHKSSIRFAVLLAITVVIATAHYLLEKVIDVI